MVSFQRSKKSWDATGHDHSFPLSIHVEAELEWGSKSTGQMGPRTTKVVTCVADLTENGIFY